LNEIFQKWANPEEEETEEPIAAKEEEEESDLPWEKKQDANFNLQTKQSKADKFNDLFND